MECRNIQEMLGAYLEGTVSAEERRLIEGHIPSCDRCSNILKDLKRAKELIKGLPEVKPPPWFEQRVMARIRAEEEAKEGLFRKVFYPIHIKVPIEGLATVLIAAVAFLVFRAVGPEIKTNQAPSGPQVAAKGGASKGAPQEALKGETNLPALKHEVFARRHSQGERTRMEAGSPSAGPEIVTKKSFSPSGGEGREGKGDQKDGGERRENAPLSQLPAAPAVVPRQRDEMAAGSEMKGDVQRKVLSSPGQELGLAKRSAESIGVTIHAGDVAKATREIESLLVQFGANSIARQSVEGGEVMTAELRVEKLKDLLEQMKAVGEVKEKDVGGEGTDMAAGSIRVRIEISRSIDD